MCIRVDLLETFDQKVSIAKGEGENGDSESEVMKA